MKKTIETGSDFSGVGAFDQALERLGIKQDKKFACDWDKFARQTYIYNFGEPAYYPENVYDREIPKESLDIYMTSPPCQSFSLAGKRKGEDSKNGVLFYNSHEFIVKNNPRYFIFENVKGLLSDDNGKTFQRWIDYLSGKSVNGNPVIFPHEESVPYHVYYQVMNAKHYGVPQNRERIFIIGIRDDEDNDFSFPKPFHLEKRLKDVLESEVDEKYFLSDKMLNYFDSRASNFNNGNINFKDEESVASTITSSSKSLDISDNIIRLANVNPSGNGMNGNVYGDERVSPTLSTNKGEGIKIGAIRGRNPQNPLSRVSGLPTEQMLEINENGTSNALTTVQKDNVVVLPPEVYQLNPSLESGGKQPYQPNRVYDIKGILPTLDTDSRAKNVLIPANNSKGYDIAEEEEEDSINFSNPNSETRRGRVGHGVAQTITTLCEQGILTSKSSKNEKSTLNKGNSFEKLRTMWREIREETFKKWGFGIIAPLQQEDILQSRLQGKKYDKSWLNSTNAESSSRYSEKYTEAFYKEGLLREMWKEWEFRCASYRREFPEQQFGKLDGIMSKLSYEYPLYSKSHLQDGELPNKNKSIRVLQQALSEIQDLRESDVCYTSNKERREDCFTQRLGVCNQGIATKKPSKQEIEKYSGIAVHPLSKKLEFNGFKDGECPTLLATDYKAPKCIQYQSQRIRRLTPIECFRLMDFNENFKWNVSDSQAYKQAGNSIVVSCLVEIIKKLNLK